MVDRIPGGTLASVAMGLSKSSWFFTAPPSGSASRRGDPLGFRHGANLYADIAAPGLSGRAVDLRWLTLLSWVLVEGSLAAETFPPRGGYARMQDIYPWLQPLELLWIAKTLTHHRGSGRQTPGKRALTRWLRAEAPGRRFGFSASQLERYRFYGPLGTYRTLLKRLPGLTLNGDGWTPGPVASQLARLVREALGRTGTADPTRIPKSALTRSPQRYWLERAWKGWGSPKGKALCPTLLKTSRQLSAAERKLLSPLLFNEPSPQRSGNSRDTPSERRWRTATLLASSVDADSLFTLVETVSDGLKGHGDSPELLSAWGPFARFAEASRSLLEATTTRLKDTAPPGALSFDALTRDDAICDDIDEVRESALAWSAYRVENAAFEGPRALADTVAKKRSRARQLRAFIHHHQLYGTGLRWCLVKGDTVRFNLPQSTAPEGRSYRFRLWPVARLAVQCGVQRTIPGALEASTSLDIEAVEEINEE